MEKDEEEGRAGVVLAEQEKSGVRQKNKTRRNILPFGGDIRIIRSIFLCTIQTIHVFLMGSERSHTCCKLQRTNYPYAQNINQLLRS